MVLRQTVWIDNDVQGVLIGRIVLYWISALLYVGIGTTCFQYYQHPDWTIARHATTLFSQFWPWIPSAVLCLPLVIFDVVRLSNLFVGPIYHLRKHLEDLKDDPNCRPLKFRDDDYWQDLADPIHCLQAEILTLRRENAKLRRKAPTDATRTAIDLEALLAKKVAATPPKKQLPPIGSKID